MSLFVALALGIFARAEGVDTQTPAELRRAQAVIARDFAHAVDSGSLSTSAKAEILRKYRYVDPQGFVPIDLLIHTLLYFDANKSSFPNPNYIGIVDFRPRSDHYRFYLINMQDGSVQPFHTTHGQNSDVNGFARIFSNVDNSEESSLGFIRTAEVYTGTYKRSMRLDGLSPTNSNIRERAIILHGYDGVTEENVIEPLTWGCIAFDWTVKDGIIDKLQQGALMYVGISTSIPPTE